MTATNHALTGSVIGLAIGQPFLAIPLAFVSHFVLDALPHFESNKLQASSKYFLYYLASEAGICVSLLLALAFFQPQYWFLGAICAFVATSPDFMWVGEFLSAQKGEASPKRRHWLVKFHSWIQWYQKEPGAIVELAWAVLMILALAKTAII